MDQPTPTRDKRITTNLVALSSAAVVAVYAAGYLRTRSAAQRFASESVPRRAAAPVELSTSAPAEWVSAPPDATSATPRDVAVQRPSGAVSQDASPGAVAASPSSAFSSPAVADSAPATPAASVPAPVLDVQPVPTPVAAPVAAAVAEAVAPPAPVPAAPAAPVLKDGTYLGWGTCRHGDIQAQVVIAAGRIASASISQCWTRYPCSWIGMLPGQVVARQSPNVDYVSGATQSTNAFYDAIVEALAKAK